MIGDYRSCQYLKDTGINPESTAAQPAAIMDFPPAH